MVPQGEYRMSVAYECTWRLSPTLSHTDEFTLAESDGCRRTLDRRPESILGALQLTANDEPPGSATSLAFIPYDFRWYLRRGFLPARA
jgi:hypothetical protein